MNRHRYLRAYMAAVLLPTWVLLLALGLALFSHASGIDRFVLFPMAVVPNLWGLWNVLYHALRPRFPIGVFGAALPLLLLPAGLALLAALDLHFYTWRQLLPLLPIAMAAYFLAWKYAVGFFNRVVGLD